METLYLQANPSAKKGKPVFPKMLLSMSSNLLTSKIFVDAGTSHVPTIIGQELLSAANPGDFKTCTQLINNVFSFNSGKNHLEFYFRDAVTETPFIADAEIFMLLNFRRMQ